MSGSLAYKTSPRVIWGCWSLCEATHILKKFSNPFKSPFIKFLGLTHAFWVRASTRLAQDWLSVQGVVALWLVSRVNHNLYLSVSAPWSLGYSPTSLRPSDLEWRGDNVIVQGMWRPPSFVEKLLSGTRGQGDRDCVHGRDLVAE